MSTPIKTAADNSAVGVQTPDQAIQRARAETQGHTRATTSGRLQSTAPQGPDPNALTACVHASIADIPRDAWLRLFPAAEQSWDYYAAGERMSARGFKFGSVAAYFGKTLVGAAPLFRVDYRLDAPLGPQFQAIGDWLDRYVPSWITMPIIGLGSPIADECQLGFHPDLSSEDRQDVLGAILATMNRHAAGAGVRVLALKDLTDRDREWAHPVLTAAGFSAIPSLPVATLDLPYGSFDDYLASLPPRLRSELRRKLRQSAGVRVEFRDSLDGIEDEIGRLFNETRSRRKASYDTFDELPGGYFHEVMGTLGGRARLLLLWVGDTLACFNLFIHERDRIVGRYLGMHYDYAREYNLYFMNWLTMVRYCIEHGVRELQVGQTSYALKSKLGCKLHRSWIYCRHTGPMRGPLFRWLAPYAAFDRMDPDLRELGDAAPYATPPSRAA